MPNGVNILHFRHCIAFLGYKKFFMVPTGHKVSLLVLTPDKVLLASCY